MTDHDPVSDWSWCLGPVYASRHTLTTMTPEERAAKTFNVLQLRGNKRDLTPGDIELELMDPREADELRAWKAEIDAAHKASEMMVPLPRPGTDMARLLSANVLLRRRLTILNGQIEHIRKTLEML